jgi:hypothetical protein
MITGRATADASLAAGLPVWSDKKALPSMTCVIVSIDIIPQSFAGAMPRPHEFRNHLSCIELHRYVASSASANNQRSLMLLSWAIDVFGL